MRKQEDLKKLVHANEKQFNIVEIVTEGSIEDVYGKISAATKDFM